MAEDLWRLRKKRGLSVKQLANKSGVPAFSIHEYERGEPVRVADLSRLARALFVDEFDIKITSDPLPAASAPQRPPPVPETPQAAPVEKAPQPSPKKKAKKAPEPLPARPTQIAHLITLAGVIGEDQKEVEEAAGKPLDSLTLQEVRKLLADYSVRVSELKNREEAMRPDGTRRKRAHLPEGVDEYELNYLQTRQEQGELVTFKLFDGETITGQVAGFSAYNITVRQTDGSETTIHKLALAYYSLFPTEGKRANGQDEQEPAGETPA